MGMTCKICRHPERAEIDAAIARGEPERAIAGRYGISRGSLQRHRRNHVGEAVAEAQRRATLLSAEAIAAELTRLHKRCERLLDRAERKGQIGLGVRAIAELRSLLTTIGGLLIQFRDELMPPAREASPAFKDLTRLTVTQLRLLRALSDVVSGVAETIPIEIVQALASEAGLRLEAQRFAPRALLAETSASEEPIEAEVEAIETEADPRAEAEVGCPAPAPPAPTLAQPDADLGTATLWRPRPGILREVP